MHAGRVQALSIERAGWLARNASLFGVWVEPPAGSRGRAPGQGVKSEAP